MIGMAIGIGVSKRQIRSQIKEILETEGAINVLYDTDKDNLVDQLASHSHVRADITDLLPITRADLEYPTEDVNLAYLMAIDKAQEAYNKYGTPARGHTGTGTVDSFTDKAIQWVTADDSCCLGRVTTGPNSYMVYYDKDATTADFFILKRIGSNTSNLATEAVDITAVYLVKISISGSTIKAYRVDMTTPKLTATDTDITSGEFAVSYWNIAGYLPACTLTAILLAPSSPSPKPLRILEVETTKTEIVREEKENRYIPNLLQDLREISQLTGLPDFLYREAKRYEVLKNKGFTDEEIELLLGSIPQHQVDLASVTFGSFEFRHDSPTNIVAIYGDNPYQSGAILKQEEAVKSKNLKVLKPPRDYLEAKQQYNELRKEFTHWSAGLHNWCYQMIGHEDFEGMQASDMYYGELIEHKTHYDQIKRVPDWELRRNLQRWKDRLKRGKILAEEREKHLRKLEEIERLGW